MELFEVRNGADGSTIIKIAKTTDLVELKVTNPDGVVVMAVTVDDKGFHKSN